MSILVNGEEITDSQIEHVMLMLKEHEHAHDCGCHSHEEGSCTDQCQCDGHHEENHECQCGHDHHHEIPLELSDQELRQQAEAFLIQNVLLKQHVMKVMPESSADEIKAFVALHGERYEDIADMSIRMDKFSIQMDSEMQKPTREEVLGYYNDNQEDMVDENNELIPFEELEDELTEELFDELKNANFDYQIQQLFNAATIEYK